MAARRPGDASHTGKRSDGSTVAAVGAPLQGSDFVVLDVSQGGGRASLALGSVGSRRWRSDHTARRPNDFP
ncbi:MAG TPA: hypothetical protein P5169_08170, partial [Kiritimatiellia bacterium]|nr:hypothetical protein [Kiritimatiellia bacterium]